MLQRFALCSLLLLFAACASYQKQLAKSQNLAKQGKYLEAANEIKEKALKDGDDQLVYLLDYGTFLHMAGLYDQSNQAFLKANDIADIKDYTSLSREAGSILLNEGLVQYKGDDYEKVLINAYLAMNFLMMGQFESAQVEARRLNDKLYKFRYEGKKKYDQNPFAFYLSAMIWEYSREYDSAYIDYERAYNLNPSIPMLKEDLVRSAYLSRRGDMLKKWRKAFPKVKFEPQKWKKREYGEIIVLYQQGRGPQKRPNPSFKKVPKLYPRLNRGVAAEMKINGKTHKSQQVYDLQTVAIKTLDDQYSALVAKRVAGIAAKAVIANQIKKENQLLGQLAWIGMNMADVADLRQWTTLPQSIHVLRVPVPKGEYDFVLRAVDAANRPTGESKSFSNVKVARGKPTFLLWRSFK